MDQLDIFGTATPIAAPAAPAAPSIPADVQLSLFRPDYLAMRAPKARKAPKPIVLDPTLHGDSLI
ncbi:hypothetical protein AB0A95_33845 [Micromonospora sp. NPDC049230]|uniref:hypothetical protein n=1 Tax=Micromonospora sp. NPDC049230 TaxID=3155502 RepID=UPI0033D1256D